VDGDSNIILMCLLHNSFIFIFVHYYLHIFTYLSYKHNDGLHTGFLAQLMCPVAPSETELYCRRIQDQAFCVNERDEQVANILAKLNTSRTSFSSSLSSAHTFQGVNSIEAKQCEL